MDIKKLIAENSSEILIGVGTFSLLSAIPLACRNDNKECYAWERVKETQSTTKLQRIKHKFKYHLTTIAVASAGVTEIAIGVYGEKKEKAILGTLVGIAENRASAYARKLEEVIEDKASFKDVQGAIERNNMQPINEDRITHTGYGSDLCYDTVTGRYFRSDVKTIENQVAKLNNRLSIERYLTLNEVQTELGLTSTTAGQLLGVSVELTGFIDVRFEATLREGYEPCIMVIYSVAEMSKIRERG